MTQSFFDSLVEHQKREAALKADVLTFREYFERVIQNPHLHNHSHARVYDMIMSHGVTEGVGGRTTYNFFTKEIFGIDEALQRFVDEYLHPAAKRLDVRKRILLLMGPVSGGKSTIVNMLKRGLEQFSKTDRGAVYGIKGCPMHENPLHLVPRELRDTLQKEYKLVVEGDLCPSCQLALKEQYNGDIQAVEVERVVFSEKERVGIGTFTPSDPKSQDISELTGSIDFSTIGEYGSESDPRAYRFDGELNIANRGIMEFQEMLKCDEKFLWNLLFLSQEGQFKAGRFAMITADEFIVAHTNETEYRRFISDKKNEALQSRIIVQKIPYNLRVSEEQRIYAKLLGESDIGKSGNVHIAPHALHTAAIFSVLTRLKDSKRGVGVMTKLRLYDGEQISEIKPPEVRELMREGYDMDEGMSGIDPRYVINRLAAALVKEDGHTTGPVTVTTDHKCLNALDVLRAMKDGLDTHSSITKEERERYMNYLALARETFDEIAKKEIQKAFVYNFAEQAQTMLDNYLENVEAYVNKGTLVDPVTGDELHPDERLMRGIEEQIGVSENSKKMFREEIMIRVGVYGRRGQKFDYTSHDRLKEAIDKKLFADMKDIVKITTSIRNPDPDQLKRVNGVVAELVDKHGYCASCANEMIRYVGSLLNR